MSLLWMSIDPDHEETRLMLTEARVGAALRARLQPVPKQPRALAQLLEALAAWYGMPLSASALSSLHAFFSASSISARFVLFGRSLSQL